MSHLLRIAARVFQFVLVLVFGVLVCFWGIVAIYSVGKFFSGGLPAVQQWYLHIAVRPGEFLARPLPRWDLVWLRFGVMAALTVALWVATRRVFRRHTKTIS
jgi:hypothetical protein